MLLANPHKNEQDLPTLDACPRSANEFIIDGITRRIEQKKNSGHRLTAVEHHLLQPSSGLHRACFGPSFFRAAFDFFAALARPIAVVLIALTLIAAEGRSNAWLSEPVREPISEVAYNYRDSAIYGDKSVDAPDAIKARTVRRSAAIPRGINAQASRVKFITGVIAVFYPSIENAGETARHIVQLSEEAQLDPLFIASVIAMESGFRRKAKSSVGATGLMQLRPSTAKEVSKKIGESKKNPQLTDPETNIRLGIAYLKQMEKRYKGDRFMALAAYNWGPGNVSKALKRGRPLPKSVKHYASTILERTVRWQRHFKRAGESAKRLSIRAAALEKDTSTT